MAIRMALACAALGTLFLAACGSPGSPASSASGTPARTAANSPSAAASAPANSLRVSGAFTAVAPQSPETYQAQCTTETAAGHPVGQIMVFYDTTAQSGPSNAYEVDMSFIPAGKTTAFPVANAAPGAGPTLRLSYHSNSDYLDWGYSASPAPGQPAGAAAHGTVTMGSDARSGQFDLRLPFTGDDNHTLAAGSKPVAHITGSWACTKAS